jgi:hypothetical protein
MASIPRLSSGKVTEMMLRLDPFLARFLNKTPLSAMTSSRHFLPSLV